MLPNIKPWLELFLFLSVVATSGCSQIRSQLQSPVPPEQLKAETLKVAGILVQKPPWLFQEDVCPSAVMPEKGRRSVGDFNSECKSGPASCLDRCRADDADACYSLAMLLQEHTQVGDSGAQALFLRACKLGIVSGCTNWAAGVAEINPNDKAAHKCTTDTFEMACDLRDPWACTMFGLALSEGLGREKNIPDALRALDRACEVSLDQDGPSCKKGRDLREVILRTQELEKKSKN